MNSKNRTMGLDISTLDQQVQEKADNKRRAKEDDMAEAKRTAEICDFQRQREWEEAEEEAQIHADARNMWAEQTNMLDRQEADLNPKLQKANSKPIVPEETGISACQQFAGEDTSIGGRVKQQ